MGRRKTHAEHVADIAAKNPNVEVLGEIKNGGKVLCRCKICGHEWRPRLASLKNGRSCPTCWKIKLSDRLRKTHAEHVAAINKKHPNIEVLEEIKHVKDVIKCRCKICQHEWKESVDYLKKEWGGCQECEGRRRYTSWTTARFKREAEKVHGDKYDYSKVVYQSMDKDVCIICPFHGEFWQMASNHLKGCDCPHCAKNGFLSHDVGKLYIMVDDIELPTMMKIGVSVHENKRSKEVLRDARKAGVTIPALHVAKTWEGPTDLMHRIEQMMHENYEEWNMRFPAKFDGCTEFFQYTPETAEAFDIIEETLREIINANKAA